MKFVLFGKKDFNFDPRQESKDISCINFHNFIFLPQRLLTGVDNLDDIHTLEMKVNTSDTSLGNFGMLLPNLRQLRVSNSTIPYIR